LAHQDAELGLFSLRVVRRHARGPSGSKNGYRMTMTARNGNAPIRQNVDQESENSKIIEKIYHIYKNLSNIALDTSFHFFTLH
jgi:hypothetical protein